MRILCSGGKDLLSLSCRQKNEDGNFRVPYHLCLASTVEPEADTKVCPSKIGTDDE